MKFLRLYLMGVLIGNQNIRRLVEILLVKTRLRKFLLGRLLVVGFQMMCAVAWQNVYLNFVHIERCCLSLRSLLGGFSHIHVENQEQNAQKSALKYWEFSQ